MDLTTRVNLLRNLSKSKKPQITVREAAKLLKVNRTSAYYTHRTRIYSQEELDCKAIIDHLHTDNLDIQSTFFAPTIFVKKCLTIYC